MEAVGILLERDLGKQLERERSVAGVPLGEMQPGNAVLEPRQDSVADVLVGRHSAGERAPAEHPRADHHVRAALEDRRHHLGQHLRRVLSVAVQENGDVEALVDQPAVTELLVAAVAEVPALADDRDRQRVVLVLVRDASLVGVVSREVVADKHGVDLGAKRLRDPLEYARQRRDRVVRDDENADAQAPLLPRSTAEERQPR